MKIGIISYADCYENYGQLLQCYAMQAYLRSRGHEPFLIKYKLVTDKKKKLFSALMNPMIALNHLKWRLSKVSPEKRETKNLRQFDLFREKYLKTTQNTYYSCEELDHPEVDADAYICGSDQVWRFITLDDTFKPYFLGFGREDVKRIAYSASFGASSVSQEYLQFFSPLLQRFVGIGVREASGVEICALAGRDDAVHVLDPTLLLNKEDYTKAFSAEIKESEQKSKYGFFYFLRTETNVSWDALKTVCAEQGWSTKFTSVYGKKKFPFDEFYDPTIPEWVQTVNKAEVVFTNSFHCTAFAILMRRPFISFLRTGGTKSMNDRIESLLAALGLESRIYNGNSDTLPTQITDTIDWNLVDERISALRTRSEAFFVQCGL